MAALTVRGLDDDAQRLPRIRAAQNGRSMEAEARAILTDAVTTTSVGRRLDRRHRGGRSRARAHSPSRPARRRSRCRGRHGPVLAFGADEADLYVRMQEARRVAGRPLSVQDGMIAATVATHGAMLATRDIRDFEGLGIPLIDPWA